MAEKRNAADKEKSTSKVLQVVLAVTGVTLAGGILFWLLWAGPLSFMIEPLFEEKDEIPGHVTETVNFDTVENQATLDAVLFHEAPWFDCTTGKTVTMKEYLEAGEIKEYTLVDMNEDGSKDLLLRVAVGEQKTDGTLVLLETKQGVWGLEFESRKLENVFTNGTYQGTEADGEMGYYRITSDDTSVTNRQIAYDSGMDYQILQQNNEMQAVSKTEFVIYVNKNCGTMIQNFRTASEENLQKDLEHPEAFQDTSELELGPDYWSALICELPQYNDEIGLSQEKFMGVDAEFYTDGPVWREMLEKTFLCKNLDKVKAIGANDSIYDAECAAFAEDKAILLGAVMESQEETVDTFLVDAAHKVEPAVFGVPADTAKKEQNSSGRDALVWSCGDTYLVIFTPTETRNQPFYERKALAVCYVLKEYCGVTGYPLEVIPEMSAELE